MRSFVALALATIPGLCGAWSCLANTGSDCPGCPPPIGTPRDGSLPEAATGPDVKGPCPGHGTVTIQFDRGKASQTCWSGYTPLMTSGAIVPAGQAAVSLSGNPQSYPGLAVGIALFPDGKGCSMAVGTKLALGGPCVLVTASYAIGGGASEWRAFGGSAVKNPIAGGASAASAQGTLTIESYSTTLGAPVTVSFSPGSALVLDTPEGPLVPISGTASAPLI